MLCTYILALGPGIVMHMRARTIFGDAHGSLQQIHAGRKSRHARGIARPTGCRVCGPPLQISSIPPLRSRDILDRDGGMQAAGAVCRRRVPNRTCDRRRANYHARVAHSISLTHVCNQSCCDRACMLFLVSLLQLSVKESFATSCAGRCKDKTIA